MPVQNIGGKFRDGYQQGHQQNAPIESSQGASSSVNRTRYNGHTKAREHNQGYQPQRQAERYTTGST